MLTFIGSHLLFIGFLGFIVSTSVGSEEIEDPSAQCGDKRGLNGAQAINEVVQAVSQTRRSDNTVQRDAGKIEVSKNIYNGVKTGRSDNTQKHKDYTRLQIRHGAGLFT